MFFCFHTHFPSSSGLWAIYNPSEMALKNVENCWVDKEKKMRDNSWEFSAFLRDRFRWSLALQWASFILRELLYDCFSILRLPCKVGFLFLWQTSNNTLPELPHNKVLMFLCKGFQIRWEILYLNAFTKLVYTLSILGIILQSECLLAIKIKYPIKGGWDYWN